MSAVQEVLVWWGMQMRDLLPQRLLQADLHGDALIADAVPGSAAVTLVQRRKRREVPVGPAESPRARALLTGRRPPRRVLLRVPAGAVLERKLVLPLATEAEMDRVVAYEIDRISPFAAEEVAWAYGVDQRDRAGGRLHLRVALLPRAGLVPAIEALQTQRLNPSAVLAPKGGGGVWRIGLAAPGAVVGAPWRRKAFTAGVAVCAGLAVVAVALPFVVQELALRQADERIAALRPEVAQADALRRRVADRASGLDAVAAEAARVGQVLNVLGTLTAVLPDDTYLTTLSLRQRALAVTGRSASAARLIPLLAADPAFRNAAFAAPVTRGEGARGDLFSIRAEFGS